MTHIIANNMPNYFANEINELIILKYSNCKVYRRVIMASCRLLNDINKIERT